MQVHTNAKTTKPKKTQGKGIYNGKIGRISCVFRERDLERAVTHDQTSRTAEWYCPGFRPKVDGTVYSPTQVE